MHETDLILEKEEGGHFFPLFSARECVQSLRPISQNVLRRTINGTLVCIGQKGHHKLESTISCQDKVLPAFEKVWIGLRVKVGCIQSLTQSAPAGIKSLLSSISE